MKNIESDDVLPYFAKLKFHQNILKDFRNKENLSIAFKTYQENNK